MPHRPAETRKKKAKVDASPSRKPKAKRAPKPSKNVLKGEAEAGSRTLGVQLAKLRLNLGLFQGDVAKQTRLKPAYVANVEQGARTVSEPLLRWILKQYRVPLPFSFRSSPFGKSRPRWTTEFVEAFLMQLLSQDLPFSGPDLESFDLDFPFRDLDIRLIIKKRSR
ncbi:MAG: helix-turn-helix domain-containing protein [Candidatus Riflebacteria bacterium]|nr:helix-turn-helix domain-containing protein [Candidatus Riflebacteria bacterium]